MWSSNIPTGGRVTCYRYKVVAVFCIIIIYYSSLTIDCKFNFSNSLKITHATFALVDESRSTVRTCFATFNPDQHLAFLGFNRGHQQKRKKGKFST
jgi:hypothetical protein